MSKSTEIFCRLPKSIELIQDYQDVTPLPKPNLEVRCALYSSNGERFAYTQPNEVFIIDTTNIAKLYHSIKLDSDEIFDLNFSPQGTYLCLWCKPAQIDAVWNNNLKIFNLVTKTFIAEWSVRNQNGWKPQFTSDESIFARGGINNNQQIFFYEIDPKSEDVININTPTYRYKSELSYSTFQISPGKNPAIAIFIPEKSGKPANVSIYNIPNFNSPICFKNFFKAEKCQLKWNVLGTAVLALSSIDHDKSNKSYYGETNLYLLGIAGNYNSRIDLKREGPIHDITWSPTAREFAVNYGYMPSETTFFDARGNAIYSLPVPLPRNTILYSPHAKFVLVAGFGNLQGQVDVYDRQNKFNKVVTFEASNTSVCEWSPCGRFILTATTSPRLRVDNGLKIWHASGKLIYINEFNELYSIGWKPQDLGKFPPLKILEPAPESHDSAKEYLKKKEGANGANAAPKKMGAYRPPHARNSNSSTTTSSSLQQRELQNQIKNGPPGLTRTKVVPGAAPVVEKESKAAAKNRKKREAKSNKQADEKENNDSDKTSTPEPVNGQGQGVIGGVASLEEKKIRSLLKKLRAIEQLKMKQANNETLEATQLIKIQKEDEIRSDLLSLGWNE
ncbi:unnamed protein product [Candida verbasci]|uniref:Eukaryotic translation initiation factor 2A n=1 Tax=Candida verbasci TaxID=1227364 RepID=A0A9W4TYP2_9ASCO|nr:unnamed protein product [Candida verbasci]